MTLTEARTRCDVRLFQSQLPVTLADYFLFRIEIQYTESGGGTPTILSKMSIPINITIDPNNDKRFDLKTRYPHIRMVQGSSAVISRSVLRTVDPDTGPRDIVYRIADGPNGGQLTFVDNAINDVTWSCVGIHCSQHAA